jgi:hypothetical protein
MPDIYLTIRPKSQNYSHIWKTEILKTVKGEETRSALFTWPRLDTKLDFIGNDGSKTNWFRRYLFKNKQKVWGIPIWHDLTPLRADANVSQLNVAVTETENRHFYKGRNAILINKNDFTDYEVITINTVSGTTIGASDLLSDTWDKDTTYFMPVYDFRLGSGFDIKRFNTNSDTLTLDAAEDMSALVAFSYTTPTIGATYLGHPIFEFVVQASKSQGFIHPNLVIGGIGKSSVESWYDDDDTHLVNKFSLVADGRSTIWDIQNFFDHRLGKYDSFWMPSWNQDLVPTAAVTEGATLIDVADYDYDTLFVENDIINRHLFIGLPNRSYVCRKIESATSTTITLSAAIGTALRVNDLNRTLFSFMTFSRFNGDRLELDFVKGNVANINQSTHGLLKEAL